VSFLTNFVMMAALTRGGIMAVIKRSALVMHSVSEMYHLINDVLAYPKFLPGCADSKIVDQNNESMQAALLVSKAGINKWFTTHNTLVENSKVIMELVDGPFKQLSGVWELIPLSDEACKIKLELDYEFSNGFIDLAFGKIFDSLTANMVSAFTSRAKEVYGN
jgi:ribosome-associated toxin RatA of RatAB toxin-antitoxin module